MVFSNFWHKKKIFVMFFKCDFKKCRLSKIQIQIQMLLAMFSVFWYLKFFLNHTWKTSPAIIFSTLNMFAYVPPSTINSKQLRTFDQKYFFSTNSFYLNLPYTQDTYINEVKKIIIILELWQKIITFKRNTFSWKFHLTNLF